MAKRKKQLKSDGVSALGFETRPVEKTDKWCRKPLDANGQIPFGEAPWGYVVTIPYVPNQNMLLGKIDGYIVRCKKHCGSLLLQVVPKSYAPKYGVASFTRLEKRSRKRKNKRCRILNIRNFHKSQDKW